MENQKTELQHHSTKQKQTNQRKRNRTMTTVVGPSGGIHAVGGKPRINLSTYPLDAVLQTRLYSHVNECQMRLDMTNPPSLGGCVTLCKSPILGKEYDFLLRHITFKRYLLLKNRRRSFITQHVVDH